MNNQKKAIALINEAIDLLKDIKFMYAKANLNMALSEIKKINNLKQKQKNKNINIAKSNNPKLSLEMVEKFINIEKKLF